MSGRYVPGSVTLYISRMQPGCFNGPGANKRTHILFSITQSTKEAETIRSILKGERAAYRIIIERYQPMAYAVALAITGNVYLADKAVAAALRECFAHLVSLTDPKRLASLVCALSQHHAEQLAGRRVSDWNRPRKRVYGEAPVDLKWVQTELIDPLNEEIGPFSSRERRGLLLHAFCGLSVRKIAEALKIERKEAEEDLARTRENVEKALLKEVVGALHPEVNSRERMLSIISQVADESAAEKAAEQTRLGQGRKKLLPVAIGAAAVVVLLIAVYFGISAYRALRTDPRPAQEAAVRAPDASEAAARPDPEPEARRTVPAHYTLSGRVVDDRFGDDGVAGLTVHAAGQTAETDFYGAFEIVGVPRGRHDVEVYAGDVRLAQGVRLDTEGRNPPIMIPVDHNVPARFRLQGRVFDRNSGQVLTRFESAACKDFPDMLQPYLLRANLFREQRHPEGLLSERFVTLGEYTVYVRAPGYAPLPLRVAIDEHWDGQRIHEFGLYKSTTIEGTVFSAAEISLAGVSVMPRQGTAYGTSTGYIEYVRTDSMGRFVLDTLPVGVQSFLFHHLQHGTGRAIVELEAGKTKQIQVQFPRRGALTGDITLHRRPARFAEFRRRIGGANIDMTKNVNYNAPGQYEIQLAPEPAALSVSVAPEAGDRWVERRMDRTAEIKLGDINWLDFNFESGPGVLQGTASLRGATPRTLFVEVTYHLDAEARERILYALGASGSFRLDRLPLGQGELVVCVAPRSISAENFSTSRGLMDRRAQPFHIEEGATTHAFEFAL